MPDLRRLSAAVMIVALSSTVSGCFWRGFKEPTELDLRLASPIPGCPRIGTQNLSAQDSTTIIEATAAVCALIRSSAFREVLQQRQFRERCSSPAMVSGAEVQQLLVAEFPNFSVAARKPPGSDAVTLAHGARMAIRPSRFDDWRAGGVRRGWMVNTLLHEMTHLIPAEDGSRFQDEGHGSASCPNEALVSYAVGHIAQTIWSKTAG